VVELGEIAKKPGISEIVLRVERKPVVPAKPGHLTIAVAHLEDDQNRQHEKLLRDALANDFEGAESWELYGILQPAKRLKQSSKRRSRQPKTRRASRANSSPP
jgi:hypothetical protein